MAAAAQSGDQNQLQDALNTVRGDVGEQDASTTDALLNQLYNNPLGAPLDQLGVVATNTVNSAEKAGQSVAGAFLTSPVLLLTAAVIGVGVIVYFGGFSAVKRKFL